MKYEFNGPLTPYNVNPIERGWEIGNRPSYAHGVAYVPDTMCDTVEASQSIATLFSASPLLLSALIKAVEYVDKWSNTVDILSMNKPIIKPFSYPDWYSEAKAAIEAALNLKTMQP